MSEGRGSGKVMRGGGAEGGEEGGEEGRKEERRGGRRGSDKVMRGGG